VIGKRQNGKWVDVIELFFPRYLFVQVDPNEQDMSPIRLTKGVTGLVRFAGKPAVVSDDVIDFVKGAETPKPGRHGSEEPTFSKNEKIEVVDGPFIGLLGINQMPKGKDRAVSLISILGRQSEISQRELANQMGVSLGKVNYCFKALVEKGWVKANNFKNT
jgi:transcriptional antiterminator RfaH